MTSSPPLSDVQQYLIGLWLDGASMSLAVVLLILAPSTLKVFRMHRRMATAAGVGVVCFSLAQLVLGLFTSSPPVSSQTTPQPHTATEALAFATFVTLFVSVPVYYLHACTLFWAALRFHNLFLSQRFATHQFKADASSTGMQWLHRKWPTVLYAIALAAMYTSLLVSVVLAYRSGAMYTLTPIFIFVVSGIRLAVELLTKLMMLGTDTYMIATLSRPRKINRAPRVGVSDNKRVLLVLSLTVSLVNVALRLWSMTADLMSLSNGMSRLSTVIDMANLMYVGIKRLDVEPVVAPTPHQPPAPMAIVNPAVAAALSMHTAKASASMTSLADITAPTKVFDSYYSSYSSLGHPNNARQQQQQQYATRHGWSNGSRSTILLPSDTQSDERRA
ncbi:hypothetical protein RI367_002436 [Sorochytrium milnesiophthora]